MYLPKYLKQNSFKIYHFRIKVPKRLVKIIGKTEICRSLKTTCVVTAMRLALRLADEAALLFQQETIPVSNNHNHNHISLRSQIATASVIANDVQIADNLKNSMNDEGEKKNMLLLSEMIEEFIKAKEQDGLWSDGEKDGNAKILHEMNEFLGDKPIDDYTKQDARRYKDIVTELPRRTSNKSLYKGLGLEACVKAKPVDAPTLSLTTVNKYLSTVSSAFHWAIEETYISKNPFLALQYGKKAKKKAGVSTRADEERNMLSDKDIRMLFSGLPMNVLRPRKVSYPLDYWGVLIAAYSGARASEIAQLLVADILQVHGILCFRFANDNDENENHDPDRSQKTDNAFRYVPIHDVLLNVGLLEYIAAAGNELLFSQEVVVSGRYGHRFSKDFSIYRKDMDVIDGGQTLHGFRHSHATKMRNAGVDSKMISEIHGRARGTDETDIRYIKAHKIEDLNRAIQCVVYEDDEIDFLPTWEMVKDKFITYERVNAKYRHKKKKGGLKG
jgi:integrase